MDLSLVEQSRESFEAMLMGKRCRSPLEVAAVDGADVDGAYCVDRDALRAPMLLRGGAAACGMRLPGGENFGVDDVALLVGPEATVPVIDVAEQEQQGRDWTLGEWASYFARKEAGAHKVLNVLSLEISGTRLGDAVAAPRFVRDLDWIDATPADERPKVQKYCLMSAGGSFTDWHVDMGGSSVWYHVVSGEKRFWCAAPTEENLGAYARWISSRDQSATWFGDCVGADQVASFALGPGMTLSLPSGWLHAVYTPEDALVFGGNYLHTLAARTQFAIFDVEKACRVDRECRFPRWLETTAAGAAREALRPAAAPAVAAARQALAATLKAWCAGDPAPTHRATRLTDGEAAVLRASLDAAAARVGARDAGELLDAVAGTTTLTRAHPPSPMRRTLPVTGTPPAAVALVDAEERARFLRGRRDVRRSALIGHDGAALEESEGDDSEDEWTGNDAPRGPPRGRAKRSLYDDDDSDASSDGDGGLLDDGDLGALKAKYGVSKDRRDTIKEQAAPIPGAAPKKKKARRAAVDRLARRRDPRLAAEDARERGGQACEDRKKATEEAYFQKARDRAQALSLVDAALEAFDAAKWLDAARCASDPARLAALDGAALRATLACWAAQHDGAPRGADWAPPPLDRRLDGPQRAASAQAAALACEMARVPTVAALLAKLEPPAPPPVAAAPPPAEDAAPPAEPPAEPPAKEPATPEPEVDPLTGLPISSTKKRVVAPKAGLFDEDEEKEV